MQHKKFYGRRSYHDERILGNDFGRVDPNLPVFRFADVNSVEAINWMSAQDPDIVFVFGTRLIKQGVLDSVRAPFVNMHWGWSPDYRAEGIVSALAVGGSADLGVTVHLLDAGADSGDILYRERPRIDKEDNFYSIGLKLTKKGTQLFARVFKEFEERKFISGTKQDLSQGRSYSGKYMRQHPELYVKAWRRLKAEQSDL